MKIAEIEFLYEYNYWARDRILEQAAKLNSQVFLEPGNSAHGSIRNNLVHILTAEWIWRLRCQEGRSPTALLRFEDFPTLEPLQARMETEEARMRGFLADLTDREFGQAVSYQTTSGRPQKNTLWHLLVHVVNHGTEHRSQVASDLTGHGYSPGDLDLVHFARLG